MPTRNISLTVHLLEEQEEVRRAKLKKLWHAAKLGFDEIAQGKGIIIMNKKALSRLLAEIKAEVQAKDKRTDG
jgi:hypothetical protein